MSQIDKYAIANCVENFRAQKPHVHNITNSVAEYFTANVLLAAGGTPSMTIAIDEITDFIDMADGLLINLGTMDEERTKAVMIGARHAGRMNKPWGIDPAFAQASKVRQSLTHDLLKEQPCLLRANKAEIEALFGQGADFVQDGLERLPSLCTLAMTGKIDRIFNANGVVRVENGSPFMDRSTAMGCALTALIVGFMSAEKNHLLAVTSAIAYYGLAGELAETHANGPGTFVPLFLDALTSLTSEQIISGVRVYVEV